MKTNLLSTKNASQKTPPESPQAASLVDKEAQKVLRGEAPPGKLDPAEVMTPELRKQLGLDKPRVYISLRTPKRQPAK